MSLLLGDRLLLLLLLEDPLDDEDELPDDELPEEEELLEDELSESDESSLTTTLGAFFKCSRISSVIAPNPMAVKKLIENLVARRSVSGNIFANTCCMDGSANRSFNFARPILSLISVHKILIKIRLADVVSSSLR